MDWHGFLQYAKRVTVGRYQPTIAPPPKMQHYHNFIILVCLIQCHVVFGFHVHHHRGCPLEVTKTFLNPKPLDGSFWPDRFPAKEHCSRCGLCETTLVSHVTSACAFLGDGMSRMDLLEERVHGRHRHHQQFALDQKLSDGYVDDDEARFGVLYRNDSIFLAQGCGIRQAQWTGCVTAIAIAMLESKLVDAVVVCIAASDESSSDLLGWCSPVPWIAKTVDDVLRGRGVKPSLAPSLKVLDQIQADTSIRKLLFCGVGCAVQAFRAVEKELNLDQVYVLGTNCADNSPTPQAAQNFIRQGLKVDDADNVLGYEFMQDFQVHLKTKTSYIKVPYFTLPGSIAEKSIAKSCLACFDYTNGLADVVVGYMGAPLIGNNKMDQSYQTVTIRNVKGNQMVQTAMAQEYLQKVGHVTGSGSHEKLAVSTVASDCIVLKMTGQPIPEQGMPMVLGKLLAAVLRYFGPKGIHFARYSIDYHILRNYLHILYEWGPDMAERHMPQSSKDIVRHYIDTDKTYSDICAIITSKKSGKPRVRK
jgi:coenzyme F420-reducing hydrogenase beta subunit